MNSKSHDAKLLVMGLVCLTGVSVFLAALTSVRFLETALVARAISLIPAGASFDADGSDLEVRLLVRNGSRRQVRVQHLHLTLTAGGLFVGTVVSGHGPRVSVSSGPEIIEPVSDVDFVNALHLEPIHRQYYEESIGAAGALRARGSLTLLVPGLGTEFDLEVDLVF
ncbi:MAG: hypothetical protein Q8P50_07570 [Bacillota bacterium]|nr:hypothetical protein [Bacillota bacterium]